MPVAVTLDGRRESEGRGPSDDRSSEVECDEIEDIAACSSSATSCGSRSVRRPMVHADHRTIMVAAMSATGKRSRSA
ncbi:hypothetical protein NY08_682 [Rhodococcus sp. B7740]|nr:hypothetical protein NY08_682 [Rhodococcus sp. B7740]